LYEENSRPKKLNILVENKFSLTVDLVDTPNYQTIIFPQTLYSSDIIIIEVLDVFSGTRYNDTCINNILYDGQTIDGLIKEGFNKNNITELKIYDNDATSFKKDLNNGDIYVKDMLNNTKNELISNSINAVSTNKSGKTKLWLILLLFVPLLSVAAFFVIRKRKRT